EDRVELPAPDDLEVDLRREPCRGEDRVDALERDQLADEERDEALGRSPAGTEEPLLGTDEADRDLVEACELREEARVCRGVGDHDIGGTEGPAVDRLERARGERARTKASAVADERVGERDERVEDHRASPCSASRRGKVEVAGVPDDQRVEVGPPPQQELDL